MIRPLVRLFVVASALAACAACVTQRNPPKPPQNADERLADVIMGCIEAGDMRPLLGDFIPDRKPDLLNSGRVKTAHQIVAALGPFVGARVIHQERTIATRTVYLSAYFAYGDEPITIFYNDRGKIVHFRLGNG